MNYEDIRKWCHEEMRASADSPMYARGRAILALVNAAEAPPWLADAAEALGEVRHEDGAPLALNWKQVITAIHELREDRDEAQAELRAELSGNAALRRDFGARDDETMCEFVARLVATVKELKLQLAGFAARGCPSCEGHLTCAKCTPAPVYLSLSSLDTRLKALADKVKALEDANLAAHRSIVDLQTKTSRDLVYGPRPLKPTPPAEKAQKLKDAMAAQDRPTSCPAECFARMGHVPGCPNR